MNPTPFADMDQNLAAAFGTGIQTAISSILAAVATPLLACVTLWIIVQGILVMRGDMDARAGITRILRVSFVVGLLVASGNYTTYVQTTFMTTLPNWFATISGGTPSSYTTPQVFDNMLLVTWSTVENVAKQLSTFDFLDAASLAFVDLGCAVCLVTAFAVYEFAAIIVGIMVAIGPILIVGYLFDATKGVTDRWIGKLITYSILTLLINVTLNIILTGEKAYLRSIIMNNQFGTAALPFEIKLLLSLVMFFAMGAFIVVSLPAIAAAIGGGLALSPGAAVSRMITGAASAGAGKLMKA